MRTFVFLMVFLLKAFSSHRGVEGRRTPCKCSKNDIVINQGEMAPQPNGIPTFAVTITNTCANKCAISNIHLDCGIFSSANLIRPEVFQRLAIGDCLVNNGKPLPAYHTVSLVYTTTRMYPLSVSSFTCKPSLH